MGFLDSILKIVKEKVTEAVEDAVNTQNSETSAEVNTVKKSEQKFNPSTDENYFAGLLTEENFPGYTIERSVKLDTFDASAHPKCFPITFLFKKNGAPVLAVFIMNEPQRHTMPVFGSSVILDDNKIRYIRFYKGWENERSYVLNRIKENLI
ncbi:MAG: hypothetical protein IKL21_03570 [Clostridia bacterium]|nr:hypothetical protein [Clostridia bacterium]